jgi:hypothetical protein
MSLDQGKVPGYKYLCLKTQAFFKSYQISVALAVMFLREATNSSYLINFMVGTLDEYKAYFKHN